MTSPPAQLKIGVVLLNWNSSEFTIPCIESLLDGECVPWRIVVVDNASRDDSADRIAAQFPEVTLIRNADNLGFTGGNNAGIQHLLDADAELIWILNNDTRVDAACLRELADAMRADQGIDAATAKILYEDPADRIWYAGGRLNQWTMVATHRGHGEVDRGQYDTAEDVPFISGCCMLIRSRVLETAGLLDDRYFADLEDTEWCFRALRHGLRLRYVPRAVLWHRVMASFRKNRARGEGGSSTAQLIYLSRRNWLFNIRLHAGRPWAWCTALLACAGNTLYLCAGFLLARRWGKLRALGNGVLDGCRTDLTQPTASQERAKTV